jgi:hypothetical protein
MMIAKQNILSKLFEIRAKFASNENISRNCNIIANEILKLPGQEQYTKNIIEENIKEFHQNKINVNNDNFNNENKNKFLNNLGIINAFTSNEKQIEQIIKNEFFFNDLNDVIDLTCKDNDLTQTVEKLLTNEFSILKKIMENLNDENNNNYSIKIQYKYVPKTKEIFIDMNIEKIFFSPNFDSIKRIYQFIMFYTKVYFNSQNLLLGAELKELLENYDKKIEMEEFEKQNTFNKNSNDKILYKNISTLMKFKTILSNKVKSKSKKIITVNKTENTQSTLKLNCIINSLDFVIPINPKLNNTYILFMSAYFSMFNSIYSKREIQYHYYQILNFNYKDYLFQFDFELLKGKMNMFKFKENYIIFNNYKDVDLDNITKSFEMKYKMLINLDFNNEYFVNKIDLNCGKLNFVMNLGNLISFYDLYLNSMKFISDYKKEYESILTKNLFKNYNKNGV